MQLIEEKIPKNLSRLTKQQKLYQKSLEQLRKRFLPESIAIPETKKDDEALKERETPLPNPISEPAQSGHRFLTEIGYTKEQIAQFKAPSTRIPLPPGIQSFYDHSFEPTWFEMSLNNRNIIPVDNRSYLHIFIPPDFISRNPELSKAMERWKGKRFKQSGKEASEGLIPLSPNSLKISLTTDRKPVEETFNLTYKLKTLGDEGDTRILCFSVPDEVTGRHQLIIPFVVLPSRYHNDPAAFIATLQKRKINIDLSADLRLEQRHSPR